MPPRPIIHIGLHKTATSWFQTHFYPVLTSHRWIDRITVRKVLLGGNAFDFDAGEARRALGFDDKGPPLALCDEDLSGILHNGGLMTSFLASGLAERVHAVAPEAQIVIFVREPLALAAARYHQYLREGGTGSPRRYLFPEDYRHLSKVRPFKVPRFDISQLDSTGLIDRYDMLFGRENVHVFAYEAFAKDSLAFLSAYKSRLGIEGGPDTAKATVNASYRRGLLPLARLLNLFTERSVADKKVIMHVPYWYAARKYLLARLNRLPLFGAPPSPVALFGAQVAAWLRAQFSAANRKLAERMDLDLASLGYETGEQAHVERPMRAAWLRALRH